MLRVVLDVNVFVSAWLDRPGAPAQIVREWYAGAFEVVVSPLLLVELEDTLSPPKFGQYAPHRDVVTFLEQLRNTAVIADDPPPDRLVPGDPDDDYVVALARAGRAHVIVTGDADLPEADIEPPAYSPRDFLARLAELDR